MITTQDKELKKLISLILRELSDDGRYQTFVDHGPLKINVFSITFWANFEGLGSQNSVYIKIPKYIFYASGINFLSPITRFDIDLAINESNSLENLSINWDRSYGVFFVNKLVYIKEFNAIVTERIFGSLFYKEYQNSDSARKYNNSDPDKVMVGMNNFGKSLKSFHAKSSHNSIFKANEVLNKIELYIDYLQATGVSSKYFKSLYKTLKNSTGINNPTFLAKNLKGIDIRQIFINNDHNLFIIDPGKISEGYVEVDLARFIVTCRILYWGTIKIFFRNIPNDSYENKFLEGYYGSNKNYPKSLNLLIIKEYFKQWKVGHASIYKREWPFFLKFIFKKLYMDPFFKWLISNELKKLNG